MNMVEAMAEIVKMAEKENKVTYLYQYKNGTFDASFTRWDDWLFKAYPGGRKQLSKTGAKLLEREQAAT
jgi:hypothetical protein